MLPPRVLRSLSLACLGATAIAIGVALLTVPGTRARWWLTQDAVEHLAIAHAWVHGAGFVDPVQWTFPGRDGALPYPGLAMRAPVISWLAALPLALGADLTTTMTLHALWASAISGVVLLAARRCGMRWPAALAATLVLVLSPAWLGIARFVWTEATALLAFLLVLATARGALLSWPGALLCAGATFAASLVRPNFLALGAAVFVAGFWQTRARDPQERRRLIAYAAALAGAWLGFRLLVEAWTGEAPYARYAALFDVLTTAEAWQYGRSSPGLLAFVASRPGALAERVLAQLVDLVRVLGFESTYHDLGWLALPGFAFALARDGEHALERRFLALSGLGLALVAVLYLDFDRIRFPLFTAAAAALCGFAWLDDLARRSEAARPPASRLGRTALRGAPLALAALPLLATLPDSVERSLRWARTSRTQGTVEQLWPAQDAGIRPLCAALPPDAIVASLDPWTTHLWCGNAALILPTDLDRPEILAAFLDRERPGYLIALQADRSLHGSRRLRPIARSRDFLLYEVRGADTSPRSWAAPPPLACAGRPPDCPARSREAPPIDRSLQSR